MVDSTAAVNEGTRGGGGGGCDVGVAVGVAVVHNILLLLLLLLCVLWSARIFFCSVACCSLPRLGATNS